jgi:hypothetical protein
VQRIFQILSQLPEEPLFNELSVLLVPRYLDLLSKSNEVPHDLVKSSCLMPMVWLPGLHLSHELLLRASLVDQVDIYQSSEHDEMDSMLLDSSKLAYS